MEGADDRQYHLDVAPGDVAETVLLPGDTERVAKITDEWDDATEVASHREYHTETGATNGTPISVTSTGIGSPSAAIAVEELAAVGATTFIRVGSCGAIDPELELGDVVITRGAVRVEGTSDEYVRESYPAVADERVVTALVTAAEELDIPYHVGITASTDSFYAGQGRPGFGGYQSAAGIDRFEALKNAGVRNFEMEASVLCTLSSLFGLRAGAVCTVYADRDGNEFEVTGQRRAVRVANRAVEILAAMDQAVADADADRWHAGLSIE